MSSRRQFVRTAGLTLGLLGSAPGWLARVAAQERVRRRILVSILLRGAADGLNMVVPFFEKRYYELRPGIAVAPPSGFTVPAGATQSTLPLLIGAPFPVNGSAPTSIDLDGRFCLHPQLQALKPLWDEGDLAIVHATGSPHSSRSHFDAQEFLESGMAGAKTNDGWLNRALPGTGDASPLRAVALGSQLPLSLRGSRPGVAVDDLSRFQMANQEAAAMFQSLYATSSDKNLQTQGQSTFEAVRMIESVLKQPYQPTAGAQYVGDFGRKLRQLAQLIKADVGVEVAFADMDGWDHHANELGLLPPLLNQLGSSLAAFSRDLGSRMDEVVVVTMSEFGRTVAESGSRGTDHGHGNLMMVLGGSVAGGKMYGQWPGLQPEQLFEGRDLAVTTDYRAVLGELVRNHLGGQPETVFPGFVPGLAMGLVG